MSLTPFNFSGIGHSNYLGGNPAWNLPKTLGSTNVLLLMPDMRQFVINDMFFPDLVTVTFPLVSL